MAVDALDITECIIARLADDDAFGERASGRPKMRSRIQSMVCEER